MGKIIGGIAAGLLVAMSCMFVMFILLWTLGGPNRIFMPGTWEVEGSWGTMTLLLCFACGRIGGSASVTIAKSRKAGLILAIVLLVLFLLWSMQAFAPASTDARPETIQMVDAMTKARYPIWMALLVPLLFATGAYLGGKRQGESPTGTVQAA